jgi:RNA polymerase sigma factor (sigma-70 family)
MRTARLHDFEEYFAARARPLRRTAYGLTGSWTQAEDLTQETFLRLYRRWQKIDGYDLDAYARRTMVNLYIDSRKFRHETPTERLPEPEQRTGDLDSRHDMGEALRGLPRQMRAVVVLRFIGPAGTRGRSMPGNRRGHRQEPDPQGCEQATRRSRRSVARAE